MDFQLNKNRITIEEGEEQNEPFACECCGKLTHSNYGFVHNNDDAYAVYFSQWIEGHEPKEVELVISLGGWDEDMEDDSDEEYEQAISDKRRAVAITAKVMQDKSTGFKLFDVADSHMNGSRIIGHYLTSEQAIQDPEIDEFFHIAEHIIVEVKAIQNFLKK